MSDSEDSLPPLEDMSMEMALDSNTRNINDEEENDEIENYKKENDEKKNDEKEKDEEEKDEIKNCEKEKDKKKKDEKKNDEKKNDEKKNEEKEKDEKENDEKENDEKENDEKENDKEEKDEKEKDEKEIAPNPQKTSEKKSKKLVNLFVSITVDKYKENGKQLNSCENSANLLGQVLQKYNYEHLALIDMPSNGKCLKILFEKFKSYNSETSRLDNVVFYISGRFACFFNYFSLMFANSDGESNLLNIDYLISRLRKFEIRNYLIIIDGFQNNDNTSYFRDMVMGHKNIIMGSISKHFKQPSLDGYNQFACIVAAALLKYALCRKQPKNILFFKDFISEISIATELFQKNIDAELNLKIETSNFFSVENYFTFAEIDPTNINTYLFPNDFCLMFESVMLKVFKIEKCIRELSHFEENKNLRLDKSYTAEICCDTPPTEDNCFVVTVSIVSIDGFGDKSTVESDIVILDPFLYTESLLDLYSSDETDKEIEMSKKKRKTDKEEEEEEEYSDNQPTKNSSTYADSLQNSHHSADEIPNSDETRLKMEKTHKKIQIGSAFEQFVRNFYNKKTDDSLSLSKSEQTFFENQTEIYGQTLYDQLFKKTNPKIYMALTKAMSSAKFDGFVIKGCPSFQSIHWELMRNKIIQIFKNHSFCRIYTTINRYTIANNDDNTRYNILFVVSRPDPLNNAEYSTFTRKMGK